MRAIVIGGGDVGYHIAEALVRERHCITVIEVDAQIAGWLRGKLNARVLEGNGAEVEVLDRADIAGADVFIAVTNRDAVNLTSCVAASNSDVPRIVLRVGSTDLTVKEWNRTLRQLEVNLLIDPVSRAVEEIVRVVSAATIGVVTDLAGGHVTCLSYWVADNNPLIGVPIRSVVSRFLPCRAFLARVDRDNHVTILQDDEVVQLNDTAFFVLETTDLRAVTHRIGCGTSEARSVFVLGGNRVGQAIASQLARMQYRVTICEHDSQLRQQIAAKMEPVHIIGATGVDVDTLIGAGLRSCDVVVAVADRDESNILGCLAAKRHGAKCAIAVVNQSAYVTLAPKLGVDICISARLVAADEVVSYLDRSGVVRLGVGGGSDLNVVEFEVKEHRPALSRVLRKLTTSGEAVVGAVVRASEVIIPASHDIPRAGDHLVVFGLPESISRLSKMAL